MEVPHFIPACLLPCPRVGGKMDCIRHAHGSIFRDRESLMTDRGRILMCRPTQFDVQYVINPWMEGHVGRVRHAVAMQQWKSLHAVVSRLAKVEVIDGAPGLPDMCFAANAGLVLGDQFLASTFRVYQRQPETPIYAQWFNRSGFEIVDSLVDAPFEGEGDALLQADGESGPRLWAGYGVRSSLESHQAICETFNLEVVSLRLVDERFYHLDTCFAPLGDGRVMYYARAFDAMSLREIRSRVRADRRLEIQEADAMRFACNALVLDHTIVMNCASAPLRRKLEAWGYEVITCPVDEFMLAGGAVKCLCLLLDQQVTMPALSPAIVSPIRTTRIELTGHLLDSGLITRLFDLTDEAGGEASVEQLLVAQRHDQPSTARMRISAPSAERLDVIVNRLMPFGARPMAKPTDARLEMVTKPGVAPQDFYSTTIYPTDVRVDGRWVRAASQRMDTVIVVDTDAEGNCVARCSLIRDLQSEDRVVCSVDGVRVNRPMVQKGESEFAFMSAGVSTERRVELAVEELAWEMKRIKARHGKIVCVAGPVVIHTGGGKYLSEIIRLGYVQALLTGNALPTHDIELNLFGTSLGVDLSRGCGRAWRPSTSPESHQPGARRRVDSGCRRAGDSSPAA